MESSFSWVCALSIVSIVSSYMVNYSNVSLPDSFDPHFCAKKYDLKLKLNVHFCLV